jgi:hypothetical protein
MPRGRHTHESWLIVEVTIVAILGGAVVICAAALMPVLWTALDHSLH